MNLERLGLKDLQELSDSHDKMMELFRQSPECQSQRHMNQNLHLMNRQLADKNLAREAEFLQLKSTVQGLFSEFHQLKDIHDRLFSELYHFKQTVFHPQTYMNQQEQRLKQLEGESEREYGQFLESGTMIETFVKVYLQQRTRIHLMTMKLQKLSQQPQLLAHAFQLE